jgi:hypothetical protein
MKMNSFEIDVDRGIVANFENELKKFQYAPIDITIHFHARHLHQHQTSKLSPSKKKKKTSKLSISFFLLLPNIFLSIFSHVESQD